MTRDAVFAFDVDAPPGANPWVIPPRAAPIAVVAPDPRWGRQGAQLSERIGTLVGEAAVAVEHVGSTSVDGLPAKPILDIDVIVADVDDEASWLPPLESAGYVLTVREPWWHGHRMLRGGTRGDDVVAPTDGGPATNIHVFGTGCPEHTRHVVLRDWLRAHPEDRDRYARAKREAATAATAAGGTVMDYNAMKQELVREITVRALIAAGYSPS
ncbi:GrpB family protein [Demequina sp. NBRC 110057]|uniref:GrpB family protein n=1 Tax=Demequina sp. NBRC 110057 TaxID=1570346 RepID=UPI000A03768E|nr:GrpB family protein [Demequina sp. NBRC 110057]